MLHDGYAAVLGVGNRDEFLHEIERFTKRLGFDTVVAVAVIDHLLGEAEFIAVDNASAQYRAQVDSVARGRRDPVMQHCKRHSIPIIWDRQTYATQGMDDLWEEQARFGYQTGIAMALHLPQGRHFVFGVDRDQPLPADSNELMRIVADLQLFTVHAQDAALRILAPMATDADAPQLTPREGETLRWTMEGKTAWEVGNLLGISERTAVLHINNAMHKLGCVNKHQAVLKALRLGLIR